MSRARQRVRLEDGLRLDLNKLVREGSWPRGNNGLIVVTTWSSSHSGEIARAWITIQKEGEAQGCLRIAMGEIEPLHMKPEIAKVGVGGSNPLARSNFSQHVKSKRPLFRGRCKALR